MPSNQKTTPQSNDTSFDYHKVRAGHYDKICTDGGKIRTFWHQYRFQEIERMIDSDQNSRILDLGCANGTFLGNLKKPYAKAVGLELSKSQVETANRLYGSEKLTFLTGDVRELKLPEGGFDYIVISEVIEHVTYDKSILLLKRIHELLSDRGRLVLTTPNYQSLWPVLEFFVNKFTDVSYEHQHINKLNLKTLDQLIAKAGFKAERLETFHIVGPFLAGISEKLASNVCDWEKRAFPRWGEEINLRAVKA